MNEGEIAERFIRAAEIDRNHHVHVGPAKVKSLALPYAYDFADKAGWGEKRLAEDRAEFWERTAKVPTAREISEAEETRSWIRFVPNEGQRAALLAWAECMAGSRLFKDWCFKKGIHPETGRRRKDRALARISAHLIRRPVQDFDFAGSGVLPGDPEKEDIPAILNEVATRAERVRSWASPDAFQPFGDGSCSDFSWAEKRNERRRQHEARKQKAA
jgi:hypothetical protein